MPPGLEFEPTKSVRRYAIKFMDVIHIPVAAIAGIALIDGVGLFITGGAF